MCCEAQGSTIFQITDWLCNKAHSLQKFEYNITSGYFKDIY